MGIFDSKDTLDRIKKLENNSNKINESHSKIIDSLKQIRKEIEEVEKRSPEYEKEAKQSSKKASEFRNKAQETLGDINDILNNIHSTRSDIDSIKELLSEQFENLKTEYDTIQERKEEIENSKNIIFDRINEIDEKLTSFEEIYANHPDFEGEISDFEIIISRIKDNESKSSQLIKSITNRKNEIDTLYDQILGYTEIDEENGEETFVNGLKDDLENTYDGLDEKIVILKERFENLEKNTSENFNHFLKTFSEKGKNIISEWEEKYGLLNKKIEGLLPNALTAGLSHAFSGKKNEEVIAYDKHKTQFGNGIIGMVCVSLIPFIISVVTLLNDAPLDTVINRVPKIVIAILPLYIPVLWLSISSSKKMNLSKRLIEEYSHKEVLSKTFEGLSGQIKNLGDDDVSNDLKTKLLQNFLQMYSENPGKLISDYNKSDHPVSELLENSNKLENSIEKLEKIPGMDKIVGFLEKKAKQKVEQASKKIEQNLDRILSIDEDKNEENEEIT
ncbi:hypothetical protein NAT51_06860 [Flavobacterium amniphilum]|uniref:hypothetical protein n=1 Tax=Flavobacterium amniphilum TaxID=1834035 RepID=UPI00202AADC8|nr:hypothetical protein [Flavobacterium amniphilum]MCL9805233.1 hypothetical protein [Flavobacterium amniphilum]